MGMYYPTKAVRQITFDGRVIESQNTIRYRGEWTPPIYPSMKLFYFMNYLLLALLVALPVIIIYGVIS